MKDHSTVSMEAMEMEVVMHVCQYLRLVQSTVTGEPEQFVSILIAHPSKLPGGGCEGQLMLATYSNISLSGSESSTDPTRMKSSLITKPCFNF